MTISELDKIILEKITGIDNQQLSPLSAHAEIMDAVRVYNSELMGEMIEQLR